MYTSGTEKKIPKQIKEFKTGGIHEVLNQIFQSPKHKKKWRTKELEGNDTLKSPLTGKVCMDFHHFSCRKNGILRRRTDSNFLDKMYLKSFYDTDMIILPLD